jgi:hypothetical protein
MTPEFLGALAYMESSGDALAAPRWRFSLTRGWTRAYAPPSSAVGLFQFTDETFERARHLCVRKGKVAHEGHWYDSSACGFTGLAVRVSPWDATEITAAYLQDQLDRGPAALKKATRVQRQRVAAVIHLCGPGKTRPFILARYEPKSVGLCAGQSASAYVHLVERYRKVFAKLSAS